MQNFRIVKHHELDELTLDLICEIKSIYWQFPIASQKKWINENLEDNDLHILLFDCNLLSGYMNLIETHVAINGNDYNIFGIGNVCSRMSGAGYGRKLMQFVRQYLVDNNCIALLFCNSRLVRFYERFGCKIIPSDKMSLPNLEHYEFETMIFNAPEEIHELVYTSRLF